MGIDLIQSVLDNKVQIRIEILNDKSDIIGYLKPITKSLIQRNTL